MVTQEMKFAADKYKSSADLLKMLDKKHEGKANVAIVNVRWSDCVVVYTAEAKESPKGRA